MKDGRKQENLDETVKNAATGYAAVVLGIACFVLSLAVVTVIVRLVVGGGTGVGV